MKIVKRNEAIEFKNSSKCVGLQYDLDDKDIDFAIAEISGRYPDKGYSMNEKCKELVYVLKGKGTLNKKNEAIHFEQGDVILIDKGELFYWDANCTILIPCTPAWNHEQYKLVEK